MSNSTDTTYNGWANYQTWAVGMYLDGNYDGQGTADYAAEMIRTAAKAGEIGRSTAIADVADAIRDMITENVTDATDALASGLAADLLSASLGAVDWHELAENKLPEDWYSGDELQQWTTAGRENGEEHARNTASWATDGNSDHAERARVLAMLRDGDPEAWDHLPREPNLSGEYAEDLTPQSLAEGILGPERHEQLADTDIIDTLADAYETGVSEVFGLACERQLNAFTE